jgi:hypothetical protein
MKELSEKEKIRKLDCLDDLRVRIGGCFGDQDAEFGKHPNDEERAKEIRALAFKNHITLHEMQGLILEFYYRKNFALPWPEWVFTEIKNASLFFGKKLS